MTNFLDDEDLKGMYRKNKIEVPDMKNRILEKIHVTEQSKHPKRISLRAAVIVAATILTLAVGAAAASNRDFIMKVTKHGYIERTYPNGSTSVLDHVGIDFEPAVTDDMDDSVDPTKPVEPIRPTGITAEFSEKALANFEPLYGEYTGPDENAEKSFQKSFLTVEEAEEFFDTNVYIPARMRTNCETATVNTVRYKDGRLKLNFHIRAGNLPGDSISIGFGTTHMGAAFSGTLEDEPVVFWLPDGTEAQAMIASYEAAGSKRYISMVYYLHNSVFYNFFYTVNPKEDTENLRETLIAGIKEILSTVGYQSVDSES